MKMQKTMITFLLLALVLVGCNSVSSTGGADGPALVGEEVVSVKEAKETVVFKIEDDSVTLDEMYLYYIQFAFNNKLTTASLNESKINEMEEKIVSQMLVESVEYLLALQMKDELELGDEKLEEAKTSAENFYNFFGKDFLANFGIDKESVEELFVKQMYVTAITNKAVADLAESSLEQYETEYKDLNFHSITYALFPSVEYDKDGKAVKNEDGTNIALTDDEMKQQLKKAQELQKKAASGEATLEELIEEYGIAHCSGVERNYEGAYAKELNDVIKALNEGDISAVITTDAGYMVARLDKKNDEEYKEYMISYVAQQEAQSLLPKMQEKWAEQAGLDNVKVDEKTVDGINVNALTGALEMSGYYLR